jgi:hypothetical protein
MYRNALFTTPVIKATVPVALVIALVYALVYALAEVVVAVVVASELAGVVSTSPMYVTRHLLDSKPRNKQKVSLRVSILLLRLLDVCPEVMTERERVYSTGTVALGRRVGDKEIVGEDVEGSAEGER